MDAPSLGTAVSVVSPMQTIKSRMCMVQKGGPEMATRSFYEDLILDTPEAVANMEKAFEKYEKEGGYRVRGQLRLSRNYELLDRVLQKVNQ